MFPPLTCVLLIQTNSKQCPGAGAHLQPCLCFTPLDTACPWTFPTNREKFPGNVGSCMCQTPHGRPRCNLGSLQMSRAASATLQGGNFVISFTGGRGRSRTSKVMGCCHCLLMQQFLWGFNNQDDLCPPGKALLCCSLCPAAVPE